MITINSGVLPLEPSGLKEWREYIQIEKYAIDGAIQRNRIRTPGNPDGFKYNVEMIFGNITSANFTTLANLFTSGSGVNYYNNLSKYGTLTFSGLPFPEEADEYLPGGSLITTYKVKIRQF